MNTKVLAASLICVAAIIGCSQDVGLPTEPKSMGDPLYRNDLSVSKKASPPKTILVDENLADPLDKWELIEVKGTVRFDVQQLPILRRDEVVVGISFKGEAVSSIYDGPAGWPIRGKIEETVNLGVQNRKEIEETYAILGDPEHLNLRVMYVVTNTCVELERMCLAPRLTK